MIKGVGADFLEKSRIENVFLKFGNKFVNKILSEKESYEFNKKINLTKKISNKLILAKNMRFTGNCKRQWCFNKRY